MSAPSRHPSLHGALRDDGSVGLAASRCGACGRLVFPPGRFGCGACGAGPDVQQVQELSGAGRVRVVTVVHADPASSVPTPYGLARIELDEEGLVIEGLLLQAGAAPGARVQAHLVPTGDGRAEVRFQ